MLRTFQKKQITEMIASLKEAGGVLLSLQEEKVEIAAQCQQMAIAIGNILEQDAEDCEHIISLLEQYCELIYEISQAENVSGNKVLRDLLSDLEEQVEKLPVLYQVVFFPYKAAMWDSLESIWRACKEDDRCECLVVPIPYYEFEVVGNQRKVNPCYDGELFPEDVPILHYNSYHMEKERPDVVYIHNPFDQYNHVTSVHPNYYSDRLKQHAGLVVYSPYYVNGGKVSETYLGLPMNDNVDYILAQSEYAKECYRNYRCYDKVLPLGSPKLDRVIRLSKNRPQMPEEWQAVIGKRKTLMLNTSIACMLRQGDVYLKKLDSIFRWIKSRDDIALIWRPHPLLEATLQSMRGNLVQKYQELVVYFQTEKIGVLDKTPDVTKTVALSDGYIGERLSSVIVLFQIAEKPLFILDNTICEPMAEKQRTKVKLHDIVRGNDGWLACTEYNGVYEMSPDLHEFTKVRTGEGEPAFYNEHGFNLCRKKDDIYMSSMGVAECSLYNARNRKFRVLFENTNGEPLRFRQVIMCSDKVYYLPHTSDMIVCYDTATQEIGAYHECIQALKGKEWTGNCEQVSSAKFDKDSMWIVAAYTNRVLKLDLNTGKYQIYLVGGADMTFSDIEVEKDNIWLTEGTTGKFIKCNKKMEIISVYEMPEGWNCWKINFGPARAFHNIINTEKYLYAFPYSANSAVVLDKETGHCELFMKEFYEGADQACNGYHPLIHPVTCMAKQLDDGRIAIQRATDLGMLVLGPDMHQGEVFYPSMTQQLYEKLTTESDGFEKIEKNLEFARYENKIHSLEGFVNDLVSGKLESVRGRLRIENKTISDNLDGTCGENVHNYIMNVLENGK